MRFIEFLNEEINNLKIINLIKKDCKQYINKISDDLLYRGFKSNKQFLNLKTERNRKPLNTEKTTHDFLNYAFTLCFGMPLRSSTVFVSSNTSQADSYGDLFYFFPKGNFEIYWSPKIFDIYTSDVIFLQESLKLNANNEKNKNLIIFALLYSYYQKREYHFQKLYSKNLTWLSSEFKTDEIKDFISNIEKNKDNACKEWCKKYYIKGNLDLAIKTKNEIMIDCDSYYLLNTNTIYKNELLEKLKEI